MDRLLTRSPHPRRILLGQLISFGDCLYATTVARQIKTDDPECHLTWAISSRCRQILDGNPHVDAIWELPSFRNEELPAVWRDFCRQAFARKHQGDFDELVLTQFANANYARWDGNLRAALFQGYSRPITVPLNPVVRLQPKELERVRDFARRHELKRDPESLDSVILFECAPGSLQSFVTPDFARNVATLLVSKFPQLRVIITANDIGTAFTPHPRILDASELSFRENAELSHYCSLLFGCSSGITWLCTSDAARRLPTVQLISPTSRLPNSVVADHRRWGLPTEHIIELYDHDVAKIMACAECIFEKGFTTARLKYHEFRVTRLRSYRHFFGCLMWTGEYEAAKRLFVRNLPRLLRKPLALLWHLPYLLNFVLRKNVQLLR